MQLLRKANNEKANSEKMQKLSIIKIGGNIIEDEKSLDAFLKLFSNLKGKKILVHGGGKRATSIASKLGIKSKMMNNAASIPAKMTSICCFWVTVTALVPPDTV